MSQNCTDQSRQEEESFYILTVIIYSDGIKNEYRISQVTYPLSPRTKMLINIKNSNIKELISEFDALLKGEVTSGLIDKKQKPCR